MATRNCPSNKSSLFAQTGSTELGGGQDRHLTVGGPWNGYTFTSAVRFGFDWSNVRRITAASLRLRTSAQVHVGFSSSPDFYIARATADWTANGSSSSSEGGSGWGTSPTVYPGPPTTTTGRVSKRAPTSEGTDLFVDIVAIVRAWAPVSVEGGGGQPNYGLVLSRVASGDITEFASWEEPNTSLQPYITLTYESDAPPPAPTITGPTGTVTTLRPALTATAVDPDGDPLTQYDVEVRKAAAVVYSALAQTAGLGATTIQHTPTADLPPGALVVRMRAQANGVWGAWSADSPFTIDRPPAVTAWTAPTGNVSGTRRPVHTFNASDPDGTAIALYDLEVYQSVNGLPNGAAIYAKTGQTVGIGAGVVNHTPTADLPGGALLARSRVQSNGVWSAWSAYQAYTVVLTQPSISFNAPYAPGAGLPFFSGDALDLSKAIGVHRHITNAAIWPPAGQTLTKVHLKIWIVTPAGAIGTLLIDADQGLVPAGSNGYQTGLTMLADHSRNNQRFLVEWSATASGGGITTVQRYAGVSYGEWFGAIALGDSATALTVAETFKGLGAVNAFNGPGGYLWYRAQSSPTAAAGSAPWRTKTDLAALIAELPATNAYLGIRLRIARVAPPPEQVSNGSFEDGLTGWTAVGPITNPTAPEAIDGTHVARITGDSVTANPRLIANYFTPVLPGATYRIGGYAGRISGVSTLRLRVDAWKAGVLVTQSAAVADFATGIAMAWKEVFYTVPADGSVDTVQLIVITQTPTTPASSDVWLLDGVTITGPGPVAVEGLDKLAVGWRSLG